MIANEIYKRSFEIASQRGETAAFHESDKINRDCLKAIDKAVTDSRYETYRYDLKSAAKAVIDEYGTERVSCLLATIVAHSHNDVRFSRQNHEWARRKSLPTVREYRYYTCNTHQSVLDGLINSVKEIAAEREKHLQFVGEWEKQKKIPDEKRMTWYYSDYDSYVAQENVTPEQLAERYGEAKNDRLRTSLRYVVNLVDKAEPDTKAGISAFNSAIKRLNRINSELLSDRPLTAAQISHAAESTDLSVLKERTAALGEEFAWLIKKLPTKAEEKAQLNEAVKLYGSDEYREAKDTYRGCIVGLAHNDHYFFFDSDAEKIKQTTGLNIIKHDGVKITGFLEKEWASRIAKIKTMGYGIYLAQRPAPDAPYKAVKVRTPQFNPDIKTEYKLGYVPTEHGIAIDNKKSLVGYINRDGSVEIYDNATDAMRAEISGYVKSHNIGLVETRSTVDSNYIGMVAFVDANDNVYLGERENYQYVGYETGYYDNTDGSLCFISENINMYYFLYLAGWDKPQNEMLKDGVFKPNDYLEFASLQNGVLQQYVKWREIQFAGQPFQPPEKLEQAEYKYYSTQRPVDIGTFPREPKPDRIENFDSRITVENGTFKAWGYLVYKQPLTEAQMKEYELRAAPNNPLAATEMNTEQNYNMIDGVINNADPERETGQKTSTVNASRQNGAKPSLLGNLEQKKEIVAADKKPPTTRKKTDPEH